MHEMEESVRSGDVVKKKSSSGCLIIKKKTEVLSCGVGSSHKEKKRPRLLNSDSGSSDESLETVRRKVKDKHNRPVVYGRRVEEEREFRRNGENMDSEKKRSRLDSFDFDEYDEFDGKRMRNNYGEMGSGSSRELGGGSSRNMMVEKRSKMYFDRSGGGVSGRNKVVDYGGERRFVLEDDEAHLPISLLRLKYPEEPAEPIRLQGKNGVLKVMVNKKKNTELPSRKSYDRQDVEIRKGSRSEDVVKKEPSVPPFYSDSKRGVAKKEPSVPPFYSDSKIDIVKKEPSVPPFYSDSRRPGKGIAAIEREKNQPKLQKPLLGKSNKTGDCSGEKTEAKLQKSLLGKKTKARDYESDGSDTPLKLMPPSLEAGSSKKALKREAKGSLAAEKVASAKGRENTVTSSAENITPAKGIDAKLKQAGSTEKQLLREKIREMLIKAGWTIDYRPRRNRDYLDAVYINPSGTAYWSIIKAYDALQKQSQEQDGEVKSDGVSSSFAPLSDDLINMLTRKTRKKIEEENKKIRDGLTKNSTTASVKESIKDSDSDQNDEKLSSFIRQNGKPKKGRLHEVKSKSGDNLGDDSCRQNPEQERGQKPSTVVHGRKSRKIGRCTLLVRSSDKGHSESDGYVPYTGKRTLLAWLIDSGTVQLSEKVQYMNRRKSRVRLEGWITRDGIHCGCCSKILTVSKFELHAGSKLRQPFQNIILESGLSLLQCLIDAWNRQEESVRRDFYVVDVDGDDPDDDTCGICGDGGDLICCDGCPSTFHPNCIGIQMLPPGDWHCPNCTCKFCGTGSGSPNENSATSSELFMCILCEKKYHKSCSEGMVAPLANANIPSNAFCGKKCQELYNQLQKILGVKHELEAGFSWSLIQRTDLESDTTSRGFPQRVECNSKLAVALSVMEECFLPIIDRRSGINLIHNVLYNCGANFSRLNFRGFFTVVLERGDEIISAASIRIHGPQLAEMPFIGTRDIYRRQGMCRRLLSAIESVLCSLKVEKLIIPAISEHMHTWTVVFSFEQLQDPDKKEMKSMNMLVFPWTDMLQKKLFKQENPDGIKGFDLKGNLTQSPASMEKPVTESSQKQEMDIASSVGSEKKDKVIGKAETIPVSSASAIPSYDGTAATASETAYAPDTACESDIQLSSKDIGEVQLVKDIGESCASLKCNSTPCAATDPPEIETSVLDSPAKHDIPSSVNDLASDEHKENAQVSPSGSLLDFSCKTSANVVDNSDENLNPISIASVDDSNENCIQNHKVHDTTVVEIQKESLTSSKASSDTEVVTEQVNREASGKGSDAALSETIVKSVTVETTPSSDPETSSQNGKEQACSKQNCASEPQHFTGGNHSPRFKSYLNHPVLRDDETSHVSSETVGDAKAASKLKIESVDCNKGISGVNDVNYDARTDVKGCHYENAPDSLNESSSQIEFEEIREKQDPASGSVSHHTGAEVAAEVSFSHQNTSDMRNGFFAASESHPDAEFSRLNKVVRSSSELEDINEVTGKGISCYLLSDSSAKISPKVFAEEIEDTLRDTTESSVHFSPDINQMTVPAVEAEILEVSESVHGEVALAESRDRTDEANKLDDSKKVGTVLNGVGTDLGSCASLVQIQEATDENKPTCSFGEGNPRS